jgi:hypothetical protein
MSRVNLEPCERGAVGTGTPIAKLLAGPVGGVGVIGGLRFEGGRLMFVEAEPNAGTWGGGVADGCVRRFQLGSGDGFRL